MVTFEELYKYLDTLEENIRNGTYEVNEDLLHVDMSCIRYTAQQLQRLGKERTNGRNKTDSARNSKQA